jgi:cell division protein FtsI/penicillin-binding protein 2
MTATPLQMAVAMASVVNGGTYFQPYLVDSGVSSDGRAETKKPKSLRTDVVSAKTSVEVRQLLSNALKQKVANGTRYLDFGQNYEVGGKTGTAQIASPSGGYYTNRFNGTYLGYVGGNQPEYVIVVRVNEPKIGGYAGSQAAQPLFADIAHMLINNFNVTPKSNP